MTNAQIAEQCSINPNSINRVLRGITLTTAQRSKNCITIPDGLLEQAIQLLATGKTYQQVADFCKTPLKSLRDALYRRYSFKLDHKIHTQGKSFITKEQKQAIRKQYTKGASYEDLSLEFGFHKEYFRAHLKDIKQREIRHQEKGFKSWKEFTDYLIFKKGGRRIGDYTRTNTVVAIECRNKHIFDGRPGDLRRGVWCGQCVNHTSKDETLLEEFLTQFVPDFKKTRRLLENKRYELDLYSSKLNLAIELDGQYFHSEDFNPKRALKSFTKWEQATAKNIRLITLYDSELHSRTNAVEGYLKSIIGVYDQKIHARKCLVRRISMPNSFEFCEKHHLQGGVKQGTSFGLFYDNKLIACSVFLKSQKNIADLTRYCVANGVLIKGGGLKKIISHAIKELNYIKTIETFSDNRYSQGGLYLRSGFQKAYDLKPSYWYFRPGIHERIHKSVFRKKKIERTLGPLLPNETEKEAMQRFGYFRIWDCGKVKWVLKIK